MSFAVVCAHFWKNAEESGGIFWLPMKLHLKFVACPVPVFMLMSFFFVEHTLREGKKNKIAARMKRLFVPYVAWALIYFALYCTLDVLRITHNAPVITWIKQLGWQLFLGSAPSLNPPLWFQFDIMLLTLFFAVLLKLVKRNASTVIALIAIAALVMQYSGMNYKLFGHLPYEAKYPLGRAAEMLFYACLGLLAARHKCLEHLHGIGAVIVCVAALRFVTKYDVFAASVTGFMYQGLKLTACAVLLFVSFYLLPMAWLPSAIRKTISFLARYSMGVYCIHMLIGRAMTSSAERLLVDGIGGGGRFALCAAIYAVSIAVCFLISLLPGKVFKSIVM